MNKKLTLLLSFIAGICSASAVTHAAPQADLFPLKSGNSWTYKVTDPKGKTSQLKHAVVTVPGKNGAILYKMSVGDKVKVYSKRDGKTFLESVEFPGKPAESVGFTPAKLVIDDKIRMDNVWKWNGIRTQGNAENEHWQVFPNEKVKVPAGEFECVRVGGLLVRDKVMVYQTRWFAKSVGVVKSVDVQGSEKTIQELIKYHVN